MGMTEHKIVVWHHQLNVHELEQARGDGEGQGSLVCCSPWGHKESDMTGRLNNSKLHLFTTRCLCLVPRSWFCFWSSAKNI